MYLKKKSVHLCLQGDSCQECKPLFVGDPKNHGKCMSCTEFCNNHTDICLDWTEYNSTYNHIQRLRAEIPDTKSPEFHARVGVNYLNVCWYSFYLLYTKYSLTTM